MRNAQPLTTCETLNHTDVQTTQDLGIPENSDVQPRSDPQAKQWTPESQILAMPPPRLPASPVESTTQVLAPHRSWLSCMLAVTLGKSLLYQPQFLSANKDTHPCIINRSEYMKNTFKTRPLCKYMLIKTSKWDLCPIQGNN